MNLSHQVWKKKQRGRPLLLVVALLGFGVSLGGGYNFLFRPWVRRRRLEEAEEFANVLLKNKKQ